MVALGGGQPPSSLRLTICCISAKVPPESTCTMTHIVSVKEYVMLPMVLERL